MKIEEFVKTTPFKIIAPIIIVWGIITLFKSGVSFGSWIHSVIN